MDNLIVTVSAVETCADDFSSEYSVVWERAIEISSCVEKMHYEIQADSTKLARQIVQGKQILDDIHLKVEKYRALMANAIEDVNRCEIEIDYILSHPITVTRTDEDGNDYTVEEIDEVALAAAERARDYAQEIYEQYRDKYNEATVVMDEISAVCYGFEQTKHGIDAVDEIIQTNIFEIKKYINAIENEIKHNTRSLQGVLESLSTYLASKAMFMPSGAIYEDFASSGSENASIQSISHSDTAVEKKSASSTTSSTDDFNISFENLPDDASTNTLSSIMYEATVRTKTVSQRRFQKQSKKDVENLNYIERRAIYNYCSDNGFLPTYKRINSYLWGESTEIPSYLKDDINAMTEAISQRTLTQATTVYKAEDSHRIFKGNENLSVEELNQMFVGQDYTDYGFCSTSISEKGTEEYQRPNGVILEIEAPAGAQAIFTGEVSRYKEKEQEILFQRGSVFRINSISEGKDIKRVKLTLTGRLPL